MGIKNRLTALLEIVWNYVVHHRKILLPYGAILLVLGGVWFLWDGPHDSQEPIRETKKQQASSPPVFSEKTKDKGQVAAREVYSLASVRRYRPLPDLFAGAAKAAKPDNAAAQKQQAGNRAAAEKKAEKPAKVTQPPEVSGYIGGLVILKNGKESRACGVGESFDGWQITTIGAGVISLVKEGRCCELYY